MWTKKSSKEMRKHLLQDVTEQEQYENMQRDSEMNHIVTIFPNIHYNYLNSVYERCNCNLQKAVDEILKESQIASDQNFAAHISENV